MNFTPYVDVSIQDSYKKVKTLRSLISCCRIMGYLTVCAFVIACFSIFATVFGKIDYCPEGEVWDDVNFECVPVNNKKKKVLCKHGFEWNERMKECRRIIYNAKQEEGSFKKMFNKIFNPPHDNGNRNRKITVKTTAYTDGWYGYGIDFGKNEPHI